MDTYDAVNVDVVGIHCGVQICMSWPIMCVKHSTVLCLHYFSMQFLGNLLVSTLMLLICWFLEFKQWWKQSVWPWVSSCIESSWEVFLVSTDHFSIKRCEYICWLHIDSNKTNQVSIKTSGQYRTANLPTLTVLPWVSWFLSFLTVSQQGSQSLRFLGKNLSEVK